MVQELVVALVAAASVGVVYVAAAAKIVKQYERGVVLRLGRLRNDVRGPGFTMVLPGVERLRKVNMQIVTMPVPAQDGITRDNVTVRVDAVIYFKVVDAASAVVEVEDYRFAVCQMAQTSLRSIIGKSDLDDLLSNREKLNQGLELMIDSPAVGWGVQIDRVEIKDVSLPETMKRSMARQAEADRERRARVINADAELQASKKLAEAAKQMSSQLYRAPAATAADRGRGRCGEELHAGAAVPGGAAPLPGAGAAASVDGAARAASASVSATGASATAASARTVAAAAGRATEVAATAAAAARGACARPCARPLRARAGHSLQAVGQALTCANTGARPVVGPPA